MEARVTILSEELTNDPLFRGYLAMSDLEVANDLNTKYRLFISQFLSGSDVFNATDDTEYSFLTDPQKASWDALCAIDSIDTSSGVAKSREAEFFGGGTATRANLLTARKIDISRATELGLGEVNEGDVTHARAL